MKTKARVREDMKARCQEADRTGEQDHPCCMGHSVSKTSAASQNWKPGGCRDWPNQQLLGARDER